jgi:uncharacterized membrane protein
MHKENKQILKESELALANNWGTSILVSLTFFVIFVLISLERHIGSLLSILINGPIVLGYCRYFLIMARGEEPPFEIVFSGFSDFKRALSTYIITSIFILLQLLLLIIPGLIAIYSYSLVYLILIDYPDLTTQEAIELSKKMMYGHKERLFYLQLRLFGYAILCILTLGIGFLWLVPYAQVCKSIFYDDVKKIYEDNLKGEEVIVEAEIM